MSSPFTAAISTNFPATTSARLRSHCSAGSRPSFQATQADRLAGILAITVGAVLDPAQRVVDLGDQLSLAVTSAQLQRAVGFGRGAIHQIGVVLGLGLQIDHRALGLAKDVVLPVQQLLLEIGLLPFVHERLVV